MPPKKGARRRISSPVPPGASVFPGKQGTKGQDEESWLACRGILEGVYKSKDGSRHRCEIFRELPDRDDYSDYYDAIPEPECLDHVAEQLDTQSYSRPQDFFKALHLVFLNAKYYNEEGSQVWEDAKVLEDQIHDAWRQVPSFPDDPLETIKPGRKRKASEQVSQASGTPAPVDTKPTTTIHIKAPIVEKAPPPPQPEKSKPPVLPVAPAPPVYLPPAIPDTRDMTRDERVAHALDRRLQPWAGPQHVLPGAPGGVSGSGWFGEGAADPVGPSAWPQRINSVLRALEGYEDASGTKLIRALALVPRDAPIPYLSFNTPLSLVDIQDRARQSRYPLRRDFDLDMTRLFEKARRWHPVGSPDYGRVLVLQRLHNALTAAYPMKLPASGVPGPSSTLFASLPAGPGKARSMHETTQDLKAGVAEEEVGFGITTFRIGTKDRIFTDEARHKGMSYRLGDYVHLINPDDPTRPIIGQIFKTFVPTKGYRTHHVTVCWYYRPEQTVHTADQTFFEREVFKSGHFCDHPVEDILERVGCQFYVKAIRGRPQAPEWYPGWPIYICNSRYNDRDWLAVRIKNWASCIPDELRQSDFMTVVPFDQHLEPPKVRSPFVRGVKGPGFIGEPKRTEMAEDDEEDAYERRRQPERRRETRGSESGYGGDSFTPQGQGSGQRQGQTSGQYTGPQTAMPSRDLYRPQQTQQTNMSRPAPSAQQAWPGSQHQTPTRPAMTISGAMGGGASQTVDHSSLREQLPAETAQLFERDSRNQVLWFSGPPLAPGTIKLPRQENHSLEYLVYLAKRKRGETANAARKRGRFKVLRGVEDGVRGGEDAVGGGEDGANGGERHDDGEEGEGKAVRMGQENGGGEEKGGGDIEGGEEPSFELDKAWWAEGQADDQVIAALEAVIS